MRRESAGPEPLSQLPRPPLELMEHAGRVSPSRAEALVGSVDSGTDPTEVTYETLGGLIAEHFVDHLPKGWAWEGKRVLDFGCGAGRVLRHLIPVAPEAELWGCDIHRPSIDWLEQNLSPPLNVFVSGEEPPLPQPAGAFDLVIATSVFTHLVETWSAWLLELHRVLCNDGLLIVTFKNRGSFEGPERADWHEGWDEDQIGMHVFNAGASWEKGGPAVYHSEWWLRAHWGRAFEVLEIAPEALGQGVAVMRRRPVELTVADLEALQPGEPREIAALEYSLRHSRRETAHRLREAEHASASVKSLRARLADKQDALGRARRDLREERRLRKRDGRDRSTAVRLRHRLARRLPEQVVERVRRMSRRRR